MTGELLVEVARVLTASGVEAKMLLDTLPPEPAVVELNGAYEYCGPV